MRGTIGEQQEKMQSLASRDVIQGWQDKGGKTRVARQTENGDNFYTSAKQTLTTRSPERR